ncbi:MAG TPA: hypothetical protein VGN85_05315 [Methyloceanibacter sp.]|nr:hypothetical protein [Methyloceanibacter sp.]
MDKTNASLRHAQAGKDSIRNMVQSSHFLIHDAGPQHDQGEGARGIGIPSSIKFRKATTADHTFSIDCRNPSAAHVLIMAADDPNY